MTDMLHQYTPSDYYQSEYSYHHLIVPSQPEKVHRRPSFSTLLQKRPSLLGRKISLFSRPQKKKPQLNVVIPSISETAQQQQVSISNYHDYQLLLRKGSLSSSASESTYCSNGDDMPTTPPTPPPHHSLPTSLPDDEDNVGEEEEALGAGTMTHSESYSSDNTMLSLETALTTPSNIIPMDYTGKKYSNFYMRLPNGNWMVRIRDENRKIIGTYEIDGSMI